MPYVLKDLVQAVAKGVLPGRVLRMTVQGDRDLVTGEDRTHMRFVDPRVSGAINLELVLARSIASAWRRPEDDSLHPFRLLVGTTLGESLIREVPVEDWKVLSQIVLASDGNPTDLACGSIARRFVAQSGAQEVYDLFRLGESAWRQGFSHHEAGTNVQDSHLLADSCLPGTLTVRLGTPSSDPVIAHMMSLAGVPADELGQPCVVCLMLFAPANPHPRIGDLGGPQNAWRGAREATVHMGGTHVTRMLAESLASVPAEDPWTDDAYRAELYQAMSEARNGEPPILRELLNTLAGASPLRKVLPVYLTRFFPEVETVFWCSGDAAWDRSSPSVRFEFLAATAKAEMGMGVVS